MNRAEKSLAISQFCASNNWNHDNTDTWNRAIVSEWVQVTEASAGQDSLEEFGELLGWMHSRVI